MNVMVVGISGKAGHGKDTLADLIIEELSNHVTVGSKMYFANELKEVVRQVFLLRTYNLWNEKGKDEPIEHLGGITGRFILQKFGEAGRKIFPDIWVLHFKKSLEKLIEDFNYAKRIIVLVPDVRYPNEFDVIRNMDCKTLLVRIVRPDHQANGDSKHESETALDNQEGWDHMVVAKNIGQITYAVNPIITDIKEYFNI